jgi:hypothetical protein
MNRRKDYQSGVRHDFFEGRWLKESGKKPRKIGLGDSFESEVYRMLCPKTHAQEAETIPSAVIPFVQYGNWSTTEIDLIHIIPQGIIVIETKDWNGYISGDWEGQIRRDYPDGSFRENVNSPFFQNKHHMEILWPHLERCFDEMNMTDFDFENFLYMNIVLFSPKTGSRGTIRMNDTEESLRAYGDARDIFKQIEWAERQFAKKFDVADIEYIYQYITKYVMLDGNRHEVHLRNMQNSRSRRGEWV